MLILRAALNPGFMVVELFSVDHRMLLGWQWNVVVFLIALTNFLYYFLLYVRTKLKSILKFSIFFKPQVVQSDLWDFISQLHSTVCHVLHLSIFWFHEPYTLSNVFTLKSKLVHWYHTLLVTLVVLSGIRDFSLNRFLMWFFKCFDVSVRNGVKNDIS